jgi:hypothetical protein
MLEESINLSEGDSEKSLSSRDLFLLILILFEDTKNNYDFKIV